MYGQLCHELEISVPVTEAWELYGTLKLANLVEKELSIIDKIELVEGDGGVGTILQLSLIPETPGYPGFKEKFIKIDNATHTKETQVVEGGFLELGFTLYKVRLEITEKTKDSCIIKSTIEYEVTEETAANASVVSIKPLADMAEIARTHLTKHRA